MTKRLNLKDIELKFFYILKFFFLKDIYNYICFRFIRTCFILIKDMNCKLMLTKKNCLKMQIFKYYDYNNPMFYMRILMRL